jgi:uncharacterized protein
MRVLGHMRIALLALCATLALAAPAAAQTLPSLTGRVVDDAGILSPALRGALTQDLAGLEAKTGHQLVIVTVKSLQGLTLEDYGVRLGRAWEIGRRGKNDGVLMIVAPTERKVRIEVGYGLEGDLTDAMAKIVIEERILPHFRKGEMTAGIASGSDALVRALSGDSADLKRRAARTHSSFYVHVMSFTVDGVVSIAGSAAWVLVVFLLGAIFSLLSLAWLRLCLPVVVNVGIGLGLMSKDRRRWLARRQARWHFLRLTDDGGKGSSHAAGSSGSSSSFGWSWGSAISSVAGESFSGGGGSFGGGGASGSW